MVAQESVGGQFISLPNQCSNGAAPGECGGSDVVQNTFVLGQQEQGVTSAGVKIGKTPSVVVCDGSGFYSAPFKLTIADCNTPKDSIVATPSSLTIMDLVPEGGFAYSTIAVGGPWVAGDLYCNGCGGMNCVGVGPTGGGCDVAYTMTTNLPSGATATLNQSPPVTVGVSALDIAATGHEYSVTVTGTDSVSGISHSVKIPVTIEACQNSPIELAPWLCGDLPNNCGGYTYYPCTTPGKPTCAAN